MKAQNLIVSQGTGTFTLFLPMSYGGCPHVSFYPVDGGTGFGGVYFGTGNSVHPQGRDRGGESADAKRIWDALDCVWQRFPAATLCWPRPSMKGACRSSKSVRTAHQRQRDPEK